MNVTNESQRSPDEPGPSADASDRDPQTKAVETDKPASARAKLRWRTVLAVVVPVAVLAALVLGLFWLVDMDALLAGLTRPSLVPAHGQVLYEGKPLANGQVVTEPLGGGGLSALGWTDEEGRFSLQTDIQGEYVDGATVGEHRVAVTVYQMIAAPVAPPLLTPQEYASVETSPLTVTVGPNPGENEFKLVLEGQPPSRPTRPGKGKAKAKDKADADTDADAEAKVDAKEDSPDEQ